MLIRLEYTDKFKKSSHKSIHAQNINSDYLWVTEL